MIRATLIGLITLLLVSTTSGCVSPSTDLFDELGGKPGIARISARFIDNIGRDPIIREYFVHTNLDRFYDMFSAHLCHVIGGPCSYEGDDMLHTHIGMQISERDFNQTVDLLIAAMDAEKIPHSVQNRVLKHLAPLRGDIIYQ